MKPHDSLRSRTALALAVAALLGTPSLQADESGANRLARFEAGAERFARNRATEAHDLLVGPPPRPAVEVPRDLDCQALYRRRVALMQEQAFANKGPFWDDPRNRAAMYIGTAWTPAFAYLPVRAITDFYTAEHAPQRQAEVDALRDQSASQRCFER